VEAAEWRRRRKWRGDKSAIVYEFGEREREKTRSNREEENAAQQLR